MHLPFLSSGFPFLTFSPCLSSDIQRTLKKVRKENSVIHMIQFSKPGSGILEPRFVPNTPTRNRISLYLPHHLQSGTVRGCFRRARSEGLKPPISNNTDCTAFPSTSNHHPGLQVKLELGNQILADGSKGEGLGLENCVELLNRFYVEF